MVCMVPKGFWISYLDAPLCLYNLPLDKLLKIFNWLRI